MEHEMKYQAGMLGFGRANPTEPHWYCTCERWSFTAVPMSQRKSGNNKIEADRSFKDHERTAR